MTAGNAVVGGTVVVGGSVVVVVVADPVVVGGSVVEVSVRAEGVFFGEGLEVARVTTARTATPEVTMIFVAIFHPLSHIRTSPTGNARIRAATTTQVRWYHGSPDEPVAVGALPCCPISGAAAGLASAGWNGGWCRGNHKPSGACQKPGPGLSGGVGEPSCGMKGGV